MVRVKWGLTLLRSVHHLRVDVIERDINYLHLRNEIGLMAEGKEEGGSGRKI